MISSIFEKMNKIGAELDKQRKESQERKFKDLCEKSDAELLRILEENHLPPYSRAQQRYKTDLVLAKSNEERKVVKEMLKQELLAKNESDFGEHDSEAYMARKILRERNI